MERIEKSVEVDCPVRTCYNQWTQFESFPQFMEGIDQVEQVDDKRLHWVATIAGKRVEWDAEIVQQVPDQHIEWRSTSGRANNGSVSFAPLGENRCRITCTMVYDPEGLVENVGNALGILDARVQGDLNRFKEFIESRQVETGAWRGEIKEGRVKSRSHRSTSGYAKTGSDVGLDEGDKPGF